MRRTDLKIGTNVHFHSGNFEGLDGIIENIDWKSKHPNAIFGFYHKVKLSNGNYGFIEKSDHFKIIKK